MKLEPGRIIATRYRIDQLIGEGNGAEVYKVWDIRRSVYLALKLLRIELSQDATLFTQFQEEALTLSRLQHPHIVRFYELVQKDELIYYLMDFVDGTTLRRKLQHTGEPFGSDQVLSIMRPICGALHYAHSQGIIHCDVKPENILINQQGCVYLSDFGIAQNWGQGLVNQGGFGTPAYMAPEQIQSRNITRQTDIYALGVILYEMITRVRPFNGQTAPSSYSSGDRIKWEHLNLKPPKPSQYNHNLSPILDTTVLRCLEKDPSKRFPDSMSLLHSLEIIQPFTIPTAVAFEIENPQSKAVPQQNWIFAKKKSNLLFGFIIIIILIMLTALVVGRGDRLLVGETNPKSYTTYHYSNACMEIKFDESTRTSLFECVTSINVQQDGTLQVNMEWRVKSNSASYGVTVYPDANNINMYLIDDLGNRMNHISTGGDTNRKMTLYNGDSKKGWFTFAAPVSSATYFHFIDDDNHVQSPRLDRRWP